MNSLKYALPVLATLFSPAAHAEGLQPGVPPMTLLITSGNAFAPLPVNDLTGCVKLAESLIPLFQSREPGLCINNATQEVLRLKRIGNSKTLELTPFN